MPRRGENIRKRKDGRWEARFPKVRTKNGKQFTEQSTDLPSVFNSDRVRILHVSGSQTLNLLLYIVHIG